VGACVIVEEAPENLFLSDKVLRLEMSENVKAWVHWFLRSTQGREQLEAMAHGTQASMLNISQLLLMECRIPMPNAQTMAATIGAIERVRDAGQFVLKQVDAISGSLRALKQAILELAFSGGLSSSSEPYPHARDLMAQIYRVAEAKPMSPKPRPKRAVSPTTTPTLADQIVATVRASKDQGVTFGQIRHEISVEYELLQQTMFELLTSAEPPIEQIFDGKQTQVRIVERNS
jgi:type I restriction enzyme, S subunit